MSEVELLKTNYEALEESIPSPTLHGTNVHLGVPSCERGGIVVATLGELRSRTPLNTSTHVASLAFVRPEHGATATVQSALLHRAAIGLGSLPRAPLEANEQALREVLACAQ